MGSILGGFHEEEALPRINFCVLYAKHSDMQQWLSFSVSLRASRGLITDKNLIDSSQTWNFCGCFFNSLFFECLQHNIHFLQEVLQNRRSNLLEWCIIYLIFIENVISIYEIIHEPTAVSLWSNKQICKIFVIQQAHMQFKLFFVIQQPNKVTVSKLTNLW